MQAIVCSAPSSPLRTAARVPVAGWFLLACWTLSAGWTPAALAQPVPPTSDGGHVLHQRLPNDPSLRGAAGEAPALLYDPADGAPMLPSPDEVRPSDGAPGSASGDSRSAPIEPNEELIYGSSPEDLADTEVTQDTSEESRLDRSTEREGMLEYHAVFDPSVVPFKRNAAKNRITEDGAIVAGSSELVPVVVVSGAPAAGRELFWGAVRVDFSPGQATPIPSVAPDSRVLRVEVDPPAGEVRLYRDEADNLFLAAGAEVDGRHRVQILVDAPSAYFGRPLPVGTPLSQARAGYTGVVHPVPVGVMRAAPAVWQAIGVSADLSYAAALDRLVGWYRGFEPGEPPADSGDLFRDVALGRRGVCRHRSHAFVLTAQSLGIAARYVLNEAHVFVEVWVPEAAGAAGGWLRIDLGGGAEGLTVYNGGDRVMHQPDAVDPFSEQGSTVSPDSPGADELPKRHVAGADEVFGLPTAESAGTAAASTRTPGWSELPPELADGRRRTVLRVAVADASVLRGEEIEVSGSLTAVTGEAISDAPVALVLLPPPGVEAVQRPLGGAHTDASGQYRATIRIPRDLPPGRWRLEAQSQGDSEFAPATAQ